MMHVLSLGAGVQSTTMALMAAHGEITPMPDCAIFADTQAEGKAVYDHLEFLMSPNVLPFPVHIVTQGNLEEDSLRRRTSSRSGRNYVGSIVPFWVADEHGSRLGPMLRKCTRDYKINPIQRKIKEICGIKGRLPKKPIVHSWIGISTDEAIRMKPSNVSYVENRWPLIEAGMSRNDCLRWMENHGYPPPPRSSCVFCPYHNSAEWLRLKKDDEEGWSRAVAFEKRAQAAFAEHDEVLKGTPFLWDGCRSLDEADFGVDENQLDLFGNECEGMCGV